MQTKLNGYKNENEFISCLQNKRIKDLRGQLYELVKYCYPDIDEEEIIKSYYRFNKEKTDFIIKIKEKSKNISVKTGNSNSVHLEHIDSFLKFLRSLEIDENIIILFLKYHYADGTTNGSGINRISAKEYKNDNPHDIEALHYEFNKKNVLVLALERFVLFGKYNSDIDIIIHGIPENFLWINKNDLYSLLDIYKNDNPGVCFKFLYCQPWARNLNYNILHEKRRHYVQIKWYNIKDDILLIQDTKNSPREDVC